MLTEASLALLDQMNICRCIAQTLTDQMLGHVFHEPQMLRNVDVAYTHTRPSASRDSEALYDFFLKRQSNITAVSRLLANKFFKFFFFQLKIIYFCVTRNPFPVLSQQT